MHYCSAQTHTEEGLELPGIEAVQAEAARSGEVHVRNGKDRALRPPQLATVLSPPLAFPALSSWQCPSNGCPVFFREHVRIEVGDPLLAFLRDPQIPECVADIGPDDLPEESRVRCA